MSRRAALVLVAGLVLVLAGLLAVSARRLDSGRAALPAAGHPRGPGAAVQFAPSRENVAPAFAKEVAALEHRVEENPADSAALLRLARLHQDAHQPALSAAYYRRYLGLAPADRQAWLDLAAVHAAEGDWEAALAATAALLDRDSLDPAALFNRGAIDANRGDTAEARRWWQKAASQQRDTAIARRAAAALSRLAGR